MLILTESAQTEVKKQLELTETKYFRISVAGGGCSGFKYSFDFDDNRSEKEDYLIDGVIVDYNSMMYLMGSTIDFVEDDKGSYFKVDNPNNTSCGCKSIS